ncbi:hypothetical protein [Pseudoxanthomonas winnipegensis]|uniref:Uncharacterized protein n=1 Tax=Pseudoxanthomonas winnipegensis TaxID=2480810 RepID=A0A4Q8M3W4_9GAMM|nr:hypothetical protein [Pseudoxanthomonas winnipegensis]TAA40130.1 hypothetical protein EA655_13305 [Pseudoxanthomonas winnipegensis]
MIDQFCQGERARALPERRWHCHAKPLLELSDRIIDIQIPIDGVKARATCDYSKVVTWEEVWGWPAQAASQYGTHLSRYALPLASAPAIQEVRRTRSLLGSEFFEERKVGAKPTNANEEFLPSVGRRVVRRVLEGFVGRHRAEPN